MDDKGMLRFTLKRRETQVELEDQDGSVRLITIRELDGKGRDEYMTLMASRVKVGPNGEIQGMKNFSGLHTKLLELSLFDGERHLSAKEINGFPSSTQQALFDIAKDLSGLGADSDAEVGNDSEAND